MARSLAGQPLEGPLLGDLHQADRAVRATRAQLDHGRGNVRADMRSTRHESTHRTLLGLGMAGGPPALSSLTTAHRAALSAAVRAGVCDGHSDVAAAIYAGHLRPGQALLLRSSFQLMHRWTEALAVEQRSADSPSSVVMRSRIVIDAWANGPAVLLEDAQPHYRAAAVQTMRQITFADAATLHRDYLAHLQLLEPAAQSKMAHVLPVWQAQNVRWNRRTFDEMNVISHTLAAAAQDRLPDPGNPDPRSLLRAQLAAVSAQRTVGASVADAASRVDAVLADVRRLPNMENPGPRRGQS